MRGERWRQSSGQLDAWGTGVSSVPPCRPFFLLDLSMFLSYFSYILSSCFVSSLLNEGFHLPSQIQGMSSQHVTYSSQGVKNNQSFKENQQNQIHMNSESSPGLLPTAHTASAGPEPSSAGALPTELRSSWDAESCL